MSLWQTLTMALKNLRANKAYFWQTVIGMIMGVAALMLALVLVQGMVYVVKSVQAQYSDNFFYVCAQTRVESSGRLTGEDMQRLVADNPQLFNASSAEFLVYEGIKYGDEVLDGKYAVAGVDYSFNQIMVALQVAQGRWLLPLDIERERNVCVLGSQVAAGVFGDNTSGATLKIQGNNYEVVGVLQEVANDMQGVNEFIYIPYTNAQKLKNDSFMPTYFENGGYFDRFYIGVTNAENMEAGRKAIYAMRRERLGEDGMVGIFSGEQYTGLMYKALGEALAPVVAMLGLGAFMVLLVGGAGIMNVMLLAVDKRTPEIGVRKAFGARSRDIGRQFIIEAACTGLVGGSLGVVLGAGGCLIVCPALAIPLKPAFLPAAAAASFAVSMLIGLIFGLKPAQQAAKMEAVAALNH